MLRAAIAIRDITPKKPTELSGFASRQGLAKGALQPLTARALVLANERDMFALLALDLLGPPEGIAAMIAPGLPRGIHIVPAATHTHGAPPVLARAMLGVVDEAYLAQVSSSARDAIASAIAKLTPRRLAHRKVEARGIAHNRRDPDGPVDHAADVVTLHAEDGALAGLWLNFACHPVALGPDNLHYSPDFPGYARAHIESALGVPVVYTTGCAGQINLGHSALDSIRHVGLERRTPAEANRLGRLLADAVLASLRANPPAPSSADDVRYREGHWPAPCTNVGTKKRTVIEAAARRVLADPAASFGEQRMAEIDLAWLARRRQGFSVSTGAARIGSLACAFLPGEMFVETSLAIQAAEPGAIVVGYAYTNPGYIPHASAIGRGGYEVDVAWRPYGAPGPFMPQTAAAIEARACAMLAAM